MPLFSAKQMEQINKVAVKSEEPLKTKKATGRNVTAQIEEMSAAVLKYFKDSNSILITTEQDLHNYVDKCIEYGYAGIDTETTGLDRVNDYIVGASLYVPGMPDCYIPIKHRIPLFEQLYKDQLTYEQVAKEFERLRQVKLIFANADFDLAMIYKDIKVDFNEACYYDVIIAWRCLKENEKDNRLKALYNKYVLKGKGNPKAFSDFFTPTLFPYCKPEVAKLYAGNDAKITFELFQWQLPYITKGNPKCQKMHLEHIADLIWNVEFPLIPVCQNMHRNGMYLDSYTGDVLIERYTKERDSQMEKLRDMVQDVIDQNIYKVPSSKKRPFTTGSGFNPNSPLQVKYLLYDLLQLPKSEGEGTGKEVLHDINLPVTNQILKVRSLEVLINTFVKKLPNASGKDSRIHGQFKQIGADCVIGSTIIPTSKGWVSIGDLCEGNGVLEGCHTPVSDIDICNMDQKIESAESIIRYTDYPVIKVTTECGFSICGTYNHPIMCSKYTSSDEVRKGDPRLKDFWSERRFKNLEDICVGDWIEIPCNYDVSPSEYVPTNLKLRPRNNSKTEATMPEFYTEEFAELLGMYHADGSSNFRDGTYTFTISNVDKDVRKRVDELALKLFNVITSHYSAQEHLNEYETYINCMQIGDLDSILSHGKQYKRIPSAIWSCPSSVIKSYIKGLTLDSSVYRDEYARVALELSIINLDDARFLQQFLASQGILCYLSTNENKDGWKTPRLSFNADNYILFRDNIGFVQSSKYMKTKGNRKQSMEYRRIDNSFRLKVKKIEISRDTVYDFTVPGTHSFISNGFISHNTGRMSSAEPNLQNIPSHAVDIRHLFRATASSKQTSEFDVTERVLQIEVPVGSRIPTIGGMKFADKLTEDDRVKFTSSSRCDKYFQVISVENVKGTIKVMLDTSSEYDALHESTE